MRCRETRHEGRSSATRSRARSTSWSTAERSRSARRQPRSLATCRVKRWLWNLRAGRMQKTLATTAALSGLPLGIEMYLEHYKGSFGDIWMWSPIVTSPLVSAAGVAGMRSPAAARTVLPAAGAALRAQRAHRHLHAPARRRAQAGRVLRADLQPGHGAAAAGSRVAHPRRRDRPSLAGIAQRER